jgi:hypothetical protein
MLKDAFFQEAQGQQQVFATFFKIYLQKYEILNKEGHSYE